MQLSHTIKKMVVREPTKEKKQKSIELQCEHNTMYITIIPFVTSGIT